MKGHIKGICKTFFFVFNENSRESRLEFFTHSLIQILWKRFVKSNTSVIKEFLQSLAQA